MSGLIVADLSERDASLLRRRARENGRPAEVEAGLIIAAAVRQGEPVSGAEENWTQQLIDLGQSVGGVDLNIAPREVTRIPDLS